jgi:hypothetical protein
MVITQQAAQSLAALNRPVAAGVCNYVLFFIHLESRRVDIAHPDERAANYSWLKPFVSAFASSGGGVTGPSTMAMGKPAD